MDRVFRTHVTFVQNFCLKNIFIRFQWYLSIASSHYFPNFIFYIFRIDFETYFGTYIN